MFKIIKNIFGLTVIIGSLFTLFTERALATSYAFCENGAYNNQTDCNSNGYTWYFDCYC